MFTTHIDCNYYQHCLQWVCLFQIALSKYIHVYVYGWQGNHAVVAIGTLRGF